MAENIQQVQPTLYSFYGKQYDYNDLAKAADAGLNDYLATLHRGVKDSQQFRNAYADMMSGIKDGTITFADGHFNDSKGRYTNADKEDRDYYGLIANYIYDNMGKSNVYEAPVSPEESRKIKWDSNSVKTALMREIFNNDNPTSIQDFLDLDEAKDGVRGITNRSARLADAFQSIADKWDNTFTGYSDDDRDRYRQMLGAAATALRDGTINPGDYLALSKAFGGNVDFRTMLATGVPVTTSTSTATSTTSSTPTTTSTPSTYKMKRASLNADGYSAQDINYMTGLMSKVKSSKGLINILRNSFYNRNYRFAEDPRVYSIFKSDKISSKAGVTATLNALYSRGVLKQADPSNPNLMYIPGLRTKKGTAWVWDRSSNQVAELQVDSIPYLKAKLSQVASHKEGGVLYADNGVKTPTYNNIYASTGDIGYNTYLNQIYNNDAMLSWMGSHYNGDDAIQRYTDYVKNNVNKRHSAGINDYTNQSTYSNSDLVYDFNKDYQNNGDTANYTLFGDNANDYANRTGGIVYDGMGVTWSRPKKAMGTGDSWNVDKSKAYIDGARGLQTYSRVASLTDSSLTSGKFGKWGDAWKAKGATGAYYYVADGDKNNRGQWIPTNDVNQKGYVAFDAPKKEETPQDDDSKVDPKTETNQPSKWSELYNKIKAGFDQMAPIGAEATRMGLSLHYNNKIADILKKSTKLGLHNPWEFHTPVTGAFGYMQFKNNQAAKTRTLGDILANSTSDAALGFASRLDTNSKAMNEEEEGKLKDNETTNTNIEKQQQNAKQGIINRNETANGNVDRQVAYDKEIGEIDANKEKSNWQTIDNFMANNISAPLKEQAAYNLGQKRSEEATKKAYNTNIDYSNLTREQDYQKTLLDQSYKLEKQNLWNNNYLKKYQDWYKTNGDDENATWITTDWGKEYLSKLNQLDLDKLRDQNDMSRYHSSQARTLYNNIYGRNPNPFGETDTTNYKELPFYTRLSSLSAKKKYGGKIRPSVQRVLNMIKK